MMNPKMKNQSVDTESKLLPEVLFHGETKPETALVEPISAVSTVPLQKVIGLDKARTSFRVVDAQAEFFLGCSINVMEISVVIPNSKIFIPFNSVLIRLKNPDCVAVVYDDGKVFLFEVNNEIYITCAAQRLTVVLKNLGYDVNPFDFNIKKIQAILNIGYHIDMAKLCLYHPRLRTCYADLYTSIFTFPELEITASVTALGHVYFEAKNRITIPKAIDILYPIVINCLQLYF